MSNGWTGGQYSLVRAGLGAVLGAFFLRAAFEAPATSSSVIPWWPGLPALSTAPAMGVAAGAGAALAFLFALGWHDRLAVIGAGYLWISLVAAGAGAGGPTPGAALALVAFHLALPAAPYGSAAARGRIDPDGGWRFPGAVTGAAWLLLVTSHAAVAADRLSEPHWRDGTAFAAMIERSSAWAAMEEVILGWPAPALRGVTWGTLVATALLLPLCLPRRTRPWAWLGLFSIQLVTLVLFRSAGSASLLVVLHLYALDPAWIPPFRPAETDRVFYDGRCGLCHRAVRFLLAEDRQGSRFCFAPLLGTMFERLVPETVRTDLPDSIVLRLPDETLLTRSAAVAFALRRLGGLWRPLARLGSWIPESVRDRAYDSVAVVRRRLFARPDETCPLIPAGLRPRFDLDDAIVQAAPAAPAARNDPR